MNKLLLTVAWLVAILGAYLLVLVPLEFLKTSLEAEKRLPNLWGTIPLLCIGLGFLLIAVRFISKKDAESAVFLSQGAGLAAWIGTTGMAKNFFRSESALTTAAAIGIPVLVGVAVYHLLMRGAASRITKMANGA